MTAGGQRKKTEKMGPANFAQVARFAESSSRGNHLLGSTRSLADQAGALMKAVCAVSKLFLRFAHYVIDSELERARMINCVRSGLGFRADLDFKRRRRQEPRATRSRAVASLRIWALRLETRLAKMSGRLSRV